MNSIPCLHTYKLPRSPTNPINSPTISVNPPSQPDHPPRNDPSPKSPRHRPRRHDASLHPTTKKVAPAYSRQNRRIRYIHAGGRESWSGVERRGCSCRGGEVVLLDGADHAAELRGGSAGVGCVDGEGGCRCRVCRGDCCQLDVVPVGVKVIVVRPKKC